MATQQLVFKSTEANFVVGLNKSVVGKITAGEDSGEAGSWPNLIAWAYAHTLAKVYQNKPGDVYERWTQEEGKSGVLREGAMTFKGPAVPLHKTDSKSFTFANRLKVCSCSCPAGHSFFFAGPVNPKCWTDGTLGKTELREEMVLCLYDNANAVFTNHKGQLLYLSRQHLKEEDVALIPSLAKRPVPTPCRPSIRRNLCKEMEEVQGAKKQKEEEAEEEEEEEAAEEEEQEEEVEEYPGNQEACPAIAKFIHENTDLFSTE